MDFEIPPEIHSRRSMRSTRSSNVKSSPWSSPTTTSGFDHRREYAGPRLRERRRPAGVNGRSSWRRCAAELTRPAGSVTRSAGIRRTRRRQSRDGDHPRASRSERTRPAQRPPERELDRRKLPDGVDDARLGTEQQRTDWMPGFLDGTRRLAFGLTEPNHGSDATYLETTATPDGDEWVVNGRKRFNSGLHHATHDIVFARDIRRAGLAARHHRLPRADRRRRLPRRFLLVDVQHADRPRRGDHQ